MVGQAHSNDVLYEEALVFGIIKEPKKKEPSAERPVTNLEQDKLAYCKALRSDPEYAIDINPKYLRYQNRDNAREEKKAVQVMSPDKNGNPF